MYLSRLVACAALGLVALLPSAAHAATSAPAPVCTQQFDAYTATAAQKTTCGVQSFPRLNTEVVKTGPATGATAYHYTVAGAPTTYLVPPASFNAATASPETLKAYGIPPRPNGADPAATAMWDAMAKNLHIQPPPADIVSVPRPLSTALTPTANATSTNWSGILDHITTAFTSNSALWTEPSAGTTTCSGNSAVTWGGLGGWGGSTHLAQNGTGINTGGLGQHQAWSEILPAQATIVPQAIYATAGSPFLTGVAYNGSNNFSFFFYNYANGASLAYSVTANGYDGSTSEFIVERPSYSGTPSPLTNFGSVHFLGTESDHNPSENYNYDGVTMYNNAFTHVLAVPHNIHGDGIFDDDWYACS